MTEQERIDAEIHSFIVDRRHFDYIETERNADLIGNWLEREGLEVSAESLHAAYEVLHSVLDIDPRFTRPRAPAAPIPQPAPPAPIPQTVQPESEPRLHAVERRPGESSWMAARRAFAEQQVSAQRKARQEMRAAMQSQPPRRSQSREINNLYAAVRKPRGKGAALSTQCLRMKRYGTKQCRRKILMSDSRGMDGREIRAHPA